jgi:short-subunit dehydrogenase
MTPSRVIAITGASAGIGRATALRLARGRAALALCARRPDRLAAVSAEIEQAGGAALTFTADVTDDQAMLRFVGEAVQRFGRLDAMICNAGFGLYGAIDAIEPARMRRLLDVNVMGTYNAAYAALPVFRRQGRGHLVIVSFIVGQRGIPFMAAYSATKFAQVGLAESLRAELAGSDIRVSVIYPISTRTEFHEVMMRESGFATRASGPRQDAAQVADAIARVLDRPRPEVYPFMPSKGLAIINAIAPGVCDRLVKRWGREPATADPA